MQKGIIGKKVGMTQVFDEKGNVVPVTVIEAGPCVVVQKKTAETDGYTAVQLGFGDVSAKRVNKPMKGHFDKRMSRPRRPCVSSASKTATPTTSATSSRPTPSPPASGWTSAAPARAKGTPVPSSAGISIGSRKPTVPARSPAMRVLWVPAPLRPVSLKA